MSLNLFKHNYRAFVAAYCRLVENETLQCVRYREKRYGKYSSLVKLFLEFYFPGCRIKQKLQIVFGNYLSDFVCQISVILYDLHYLAS